MTSDLSFRWATPADIPALIALVRLAYRSDTLQGWTTEAALVTDDRIDEVGMLHKITDPHGQILIAHAPSSSELLACCEIVREPSPSKAACFGLFSVDPRAQNGGIGRRVLAEAERVAKGEMGVGVMEMHVLWMRVELIAYYERRGYEVVKGETLPFPYEHVVNPRAGMREDLHFIVLKKVLA